MELFRIAKVKKINFVKIFIFFSTCFRFDKMSFMRRVPLLAILLGSLLVAQTFELNEHHNQNPMKESHVSKSKKQFHGFYAKMLDQIQIIAMKNYSNKGQLIEDLLYVQGEILNSDQLNEKEFQFLLDILDKLMRAKQFKTSNYFRAG